MPNNLLISIKKNKTGISIMILSAVCTSFGQYFWKISGGSNLLLLFIGFAFYGIGAICMITAFKFGSFSVIHPMLSLSYIFAIMIGVFLLNENINSKMIIGLFLVLFGVVLIGVGDE
jgi:drug/metabolite transporter (DMT)-like permease